MEVTSHCTPNSPSGAPLPRWVIATRSPFAANARAIASPMPRLPPVTSTVRRSLSSTHSTLADCAGTSSRERRYSSGTVGGMRAIQLTEFGGPETLVVSEVPDPGAGDGQQVFDVLAAGVNYADTHQTEDSYLAKQTLPMIPGGEVVVRDADGRRLLGLLGAGGYAERIAARPAPAVPDAGRGVATAPR